MQSSATVSSGRRRKNRGTRATPYSTSGRKRKAEPPAIDFLPNFTPTTNQQAFIKDVVGKTWQLHHVSPLWQLSTTESVLNTYAQHLTTLLSQAAKIPDSGLSVSVTVAHRIGLDGSDGLRVSATKKAANKDVVVLEAFLSRLGRVDGVQPGFTSLPLLLTRGPHTLVLELQQWLQTSFDCHITPHGLEPDDLSLLLGQFATAEKSGRGLGGVELVYKTPPTVTQEGLSTVSVALPYESVVSIWDRAGSSDEEKRAGLMGSLQCHVESQLGLKIQVMSLQRVSTPVLHAEATGRVKFTSEDPIIQVLSVLQSRHF